MGKKVVNFIAKSTDTFAELMIIYIVMITIAATGYAYFEHKDFWTGIWWAIVTAMTVGYGDTYPVTVMGRALAIVLMHAVPLFLAPLVVVQLIKNVMDDKDKFTNGEQEELLKNSRIMTKYITSLKKGGKK